MLSHDHPMYTDPSYDPCAMPEARHDEGEYAGTWQFTGLASSPGPSLAALPTRAQVAERLRILAESEAA